MPDRAAMILMLHAVELGWDREREVGEQVEYPAESEFSRKARIMTRAMQLFDDGQQWEQAIAINEELTKRYRHDLADYLKVAELLEKQALYFRSVCPPPPSRVALSSAAARSSLLCPLEPPLPTWQVAPAHQCAVGDQGASASRVLPGRFLRQGLPRQL
jgi:hypothetical protein